MEFDINDVDSNALEGYHSSVAKVVDGKRINFSAGTGTRAKFELIQHNIKQAHHKLRKFILQNSPTSKIS